MSRGPCTTKGTQPTVGRPRSVSGSCSSGITCGPGTGRRCRGWESLFSQVRVVSADSLPRREGVVPPILKFPSGPRVGGGFVAPDLSKDVSPSDTCRPSREGVESWGLGREGTPCPSPPQTRRNPPPGQGVSDPRRGVGGPYSPNQSEGPVRRVLPQTARTTRYTTRRKEETHNPRGGRGGVLPNPRRQDPQR